MTPLVVVGTEGVDGGSGGGVDQKKELSVLQIKNKTREK